jgi:hypothetical protein
MHIGVLVDCSMALGQANHMVHPLVIVWYYHVNSSRSEFAPGVLGQKDQKKLNDKGNVHPNKKET